MVVPLLLTYQVDSARAWPAAAPEPYRVDDDSAVETVRTTGLPIRIHNKPAPRWMTKTRPGGLLVGLIQSVASLMPASWNHIVEWLGLLEGLRRAS